MSLATAPPIVRPTALPVRPEGIPKHLLRDARWVGWQYRPKPKSPGEWTKEPYRAADPSVHASSTDPMTWATFDAAFMAYQTGRVLDGIGWNLEGSGVVGLDLDNALDERGRIKPWAREIVDAFPGYWEVSPSGRGLRGLALGTLPPGRRKVTHHGCTVEIYAAGRFLTITGHAIRPVEGDDLPELQDAIDAIHARVFGGAALDDSAGVITTMTGAAETVPPEYLPVLEAVMGGRYAASMARVWSGDYADFKGDESNGEWALAREITYHAMDLGLEGDAPALAIESLMRAGPYRPKWESPRKVTRDGTTITTTWLGRTIGRAIASRERPGPTLVLDDDAPPAEEVPAAETPELELARLRRELARERAVGAVRASALRYERARANGLDRRAKDTRDILRNPSLSPTDKVVFMTIAWRVESGVSRGQDESRIVYPEVAEASGVSTSTVGRTLKRCAVDIEAPDANPDAPLVKRTVTEWREVEGAGRQPTSTVYLRPKGQGSLLAAAASYRPPEERKHGGARLPRCPEHPTADLVIRSTTHCASCGDQLGEPTASLRRQVASVGDAPSGASVVGRNLKGRQVDSVEKPAGLREQDARVGPRLGLDAEDDEMLARRAEAAQAIPLGRAPDKWKQPEIPESETNGHGESIGRIVMTREGGHVPAGPLVHGVSARPWGSPAPVPPELPPWRCYACGWGGRIHREQFGDWVCGGCTVIIGGPPASEVAG